MNPILQLKGRLQSRKNPARPHGKSFPKGKTLDVAHMVDLRDQFRAVLQFWENDQSIGGALVSIHYNQVVAKSNRISTMLSTSKEPSQASVRGAIFEREEQGGRILHKHVFTHFVSLATLRRTIDDITVAVDVLNVSSPGIVNADIAENIHISDSGQWKGLSRSKLLGYVRDALYVERVGVDFHKPNTRDECIVSIFDTGIETKKLLARFGISIFDDRILNKTTLRLRADEIQQLVSKAPYLIAMQLTDFREIAKDDESAVSTQDTGSIIPPPKDEPTIGVIDTQFDTSVYFSEWVTYTNMLSKEIEIRPEDKWHGTSVASIIVDGPRGNPRLEDGCGRFKVRHFGVATSRGFSSFEILKMIRDVVSQNRDISVWNLSLGSDLAISENFISPEGAILDDIQREFDVVFVVAGTNVPVGVHDENMKIGAPADSLNAIVVNAVDFSGRPASYTRSGPVLSFFNKPDICYYGGDGNTCEELMVVCRGLGASYVAGTSYAAPWVARKLSYLIDIMGFRREIAKALLIDAAAGWNAPTDMTRKGYGILPVHINDIVQSKDDEIRFALTGVADKYETYTYELPVPLVNDAYPYWARVTLAYFPYCDRSQGVDYTGTEMDVHFGRVRVDDDNLPHVHSISGNKQGDDGMQVIHENEARQMFRKWDNLKHVVEKVSASPRPRKVLGPSKLWGLSVKTKERKQVGTRDKIPFGVVVTLREMNGVNRIYDFIQRCQAYGWIVDTIDVQSRLDIYAKAEEEIVLE